MNVDEYVDQLESPELKFVEEDYYTNASGRTGYKAIYKNANLYLWFSVSSTETRFAPDEVVMAITSTTRCIKRENPYPNEKGNIGFEATVHSAGHAFMLGASERYPLFLQT